MPVQERSAILQEIGAELHAGVLAYVTGDRENLETEVGSDVLRRVPRHLEAIGKQDRLALVLYTLGGDVNTPWRFVNFLRVDPGARCSNRNPSRRSLQTSFRSSWSGPTSRRPRRAIRS